MKILILIALVVVLIGVFAFGRVEAQPNFQIVSPQDDGIIEGDVFIKLEIENFETVEPPESGVLKNVEGQGHFHVYLDRSETTYEQFASDTYVLKLSPGEHEIRVSMRNNDHTPFGIDKNITVIVAS